MLTLYNNFYSGWFIKPTVELLFEMLASKKKPNLYILSFSLSLSLSLSFLVLST
jgi:hypothetical protein